MKQQGIIRHVGVDQYGQTYWLGRHPRKELLALLCRTRAEKLYRDDTSPQGYRHVGYVVGKLWIEIFRLDLIGGA
jgi:hypothetical protein